NIRFQVLFHSPSGVLFTFPSRYLFTIGRQNVFSLGEWSPRIPAGFHVSDSTLEPIMSQIHFAYRIVTFCDRPFHAVQLCSDCYLPPIEERWARNPWMHASRFGLSPFRSPLLRVSRLISFPPGTEMFHFPGLPSLQL